MYLHIQIYCYIISIKTTYLTNINTYKGHIRFKDSIFVKKCVVMGSLIDRDKLLINC